MLRAFGTLYRNSSLQTFVKTVFVTFFRSFEKLNKGGMKPLKAVKVLLDQGKIGDTVLLLDEIYLQKDVQYQGSKLVGVDSEGNLFKGVMKFIINSLK